MLNISDVWCLAVIKLGKSFSLLSNISNSGPVRNNAGPDHWSALSQSGAEAPPHPPDQGSPLLTGGSQGITRRQEERWSHIALLRRPYCRDNIESAVSISAEEAPPGLRLRVGGGEDLLRWRRWRRVGEVRAGPDPPAAAAQKALRYRIRAFIWFLPPSSLVRGKLSYRSGDIISTGHNLIELWFNYCLRIFRVRFIWSVIQFTSFGLSTERLRQTRQQIW